MITSNISTAKNELSRLLHLVQTGETVTILDRKKPIAKLVPIAKTLDDEPQKRLSEMAAQGIIALPDKPTQVLPDFAEINEFPCTQPAGVLDALLEERKEGR
ncbi:MAG: type II toxin-antitoxin system prevent-host-death family antitoxin [Verrucomicrobia bacterium]|nr:type II toxin-antitoxin system prevent-host-death family antitoxin [Verrucomicrobiota bacterium]MCH8527331.1 type II toxin-antitoxin system prevent-host-death family antitoxin [Kiritimatiellia bacterium]